jgi:DNA invertase Pin-like site-specific DNA recombinase
MLHDVVKRANLKKRVAHSTESGQAHVIVERTLDGLAAARRAGKRLGRPLGKHAPVPERVEELRAAGHTWPTIARRLRCTIGSARRALLRALPKTGAGRKRARPVAGNTR